MQSPVLLANAVAFWLWLNVFVSRYEEPELRAPVGEPRDAWLNAARN